MTAEALAPPLVLVCQDSCGDIWLKFIGRSNTWLPVFVSNVRKSGWLDAAIFALKQQGYWPLATATPAELT